MAAQDNVKLLGDARLVAEYASRAGLLPSAALPSAIDVADKAIAKGGTVDSAPLLNAFNEAVKVISPHLSVLDLRAGQSPFDAANRGRGKLIAVLLAAFAVLLALVIADYTWLLYSDTALLKSIQEIQQARQLEKVGALRKMLQQEEALKNPRSQKYFEYQQAYREINELNEKIRLALSQAQSVGTRSPIPFEDNVKALWKRMKMWGADPSSAGHLGYGAPLGPKMSGAVLTADGTLAVRPSPESNTTGAEMGYESCLKDESPLIPVATGYLKDAYLEQREEQCFAWRMKLQIPNYSSGLMHSATNALQVEVYRKNLWILPFIGGLLGSAVFLLRFFLVNTLKPYPGWHDAIARIALGGIAGIIIGWFKWPAGPTAPDLAAISSVPFGLAFLAGFSIDIVFSLLERLNRFITEPAQRPEKP
jgi:hypothetical protein